VPQQRGRIVVAAGTNGAGKSVIASEFLAARAAGTYFNPDLAAKAIMSRDGLALTEANARAWNLGFELLNRSIDRNEDFSFESTLGGNSITQALMRAAASGLDVLIFYVGLDSPERHIGRVAARVIRGGHAIPAEKIRERYPKSVANLIKLLGCASEVRVYDNSAESEDGTPRARLVFSMSQKQIVKPALDELVTTAPEWSRPVVAAAIRIHEQHRASPPPAPASSAAPTPPAATK
jgi:predicted ABC-type ATPase